jgi:hypothetical protein
MTGRMVLPSLLETVSLDTLITGTLGSGRSSGRLVGESPSLSRLIGPLPKHHRLGRDDCSPVMSDSALPLVDQT